MGAGVFHSSDNGSEISSQLWLQKFRFGSYSVKRALVVSGPVESVLWLLVFVLTSTSVWAEFKSLLLGKLKQHLSGLFLLICMMVPMQNPPTSTLCLDCC